MTDADLLIDVDNPDNLLEADKETADEYYAKVTNWIKRGWILLQATMMIIYMIIGVKNYFKLTDGWCKVKSLFVFQTAIILYLLINEFFYHHMQGVFLILLFTQYSLFITFCLVVDSMLTPTQEEGFYKNNFRIFTKVFRAFIHLSSLALFISNFWMSACDQIIYPANFIALIIIIVTH